MAGLFRFDFAEALNQNPRAKLATEIQPVHLRQRYTCTDSIAALGLSRLGGRLNDQHCRYRNQSSAAILAAESTALSVDPVLTRVTSLSHLSSIRNTSAHADAFVKTCKFFGDMCPWLLLLNFQG